MQTLSPFAVQLLFSTTLLLLLATCAACIYAKTSASFRHRIWASSLAGILILPFLLLFLPRLAMLPARVVETPVMIENEQIEIPSMSREAAKTQADIVTNVMVFEEVDYGNENTAPLENTVVVVHEMPPVSPKNIITVSPAGIFLGLWTMGSLVFLLRFAVSIIVTRRLFCRLAPVDDLGLTERTDEIRRRLNIRRPIRLMQSEVGTVPFTSGLLRPTVVVPSEIARWETERQRAVLTHELGHVRRRDVAWQFLCNIALAFYWFHPLVWLAVWQIRIERELACDDIVLLQGEKPSDYATILLEIAEQMKSLPNRRHVLGCTVAMARRNAVRQRIISILDVSVRRTPLGRAGSVFVSLIAVLAIVVAATLSPQAAEPTATPEVEIEQPISLQGQFERNKNSNAGAIKKIEAEVEKPDLETLQRLQDKVAEARKRSLEVESLYKAGAVGGSAGDLARSQIDLTGAEIELYRFTGEHARLQNATQIRNECVEILYRWSKSAAEAGTITKEELAEVEKIRAETQSEVRTEAKPKPLRPQLQRMFKWNDSSPQTELPFPAPKVDERFELLCIVFRLAGAHEFRCKEFTLYRDAINRHFAEFKDHEVVQYARQLRNPFFGAGSIAQDRVPLFAAHCTIRDGHVLVSDENLEHLTVAFKHTSKQEFWTKRNSKKFLSLLDDFYVKSRFHDFFESQSGLYRTAEKRFLEQARWADYGWFDRYFGTKCVDGYGQVLLMASEDGGFGRIKAFDENGRKVVWDAVGVDTVAADDMPAYTDGYLYISLLQYAGTGFAEPLVEKYFPQLKEKAERLVSLVSKQITTATMTTTDARNMLIWYVNYAVLYKYLEEHANTGYAESFLDRYQQAGFVWLDRLVDELDRYEKNRDKYSNFDDFMPEIVKLQDSVVTDEFLKKLRDAQREKTKAAKPKLVSTSPANGAVNVDPTTTEISVTFDRPMYEGMAWCSMDDDKTFPKRTNDEFPKWSDDRKTCTMRDLELEPGKTYEIWLNLGEHDDFRSDEGVPLTPVRYTFTTAKKEKPDVELTDAEKEEKAQEYLALTRKIIIHEAFALDLAIEYLDNAIRLKPDFVDAYLERARKRNVLHTQYMLKGRFKSENHEEGQKKERDFLLPALADCNEAIRLAPENAKAYSVRGSIHIAMGNLEAKFDDETKTIELDPRSEYYASRASTFAVVEYDTAAYADLMEARKRITDRSRGLGYHEKTWNEVIQRFGGDMNAEKACREFMERKVDYVKAYRHLLRAASLHRQARPVERRAEPGNRISDEARKQLKHALVECDAAIKIDPDFDGFWNERARIHRALGNTDDALRDYTEGIRLRPDRGEYWGRAGLYGKKGELKLQLADLDEEIRIRKPDDVWLDIIKSNREEVLKKLE